MRRTLCSSMGLIVFFLASLGTAAAAVPTTINYQGHLTDNTPQQNPVGATLPMTFTIWDSAVGGAPLWNESQSIQVVNGLFNATLGESTPIAPTVFIGGVERWIEVVVNGETLSPRQKIAATAYANVAASASDADSLGGVGSAGWQRRIGSPCPDGYAINAVAVDGTVTCVLGPAGPSGPTGPAGPNGPQGPAGAPSSGPALATVFFGLPMTDAPYTAARLAPQQDFTITGISTNLAAPGNVSCAPAVIRVTDGAKGVDILVSGGQSTADSAATLTYSASATLSVGLRTPAVCSGQAPSGANVVIRYRAALSTDVDNCPSGTFCAGICEPTNSDPNNCGTCGLVCSLANAVSRCSAATCLLASCSVGFADLDHASGNGCEYACPVYPPVAEVCNQVDDNCDGAVDNGATCGVVAGFVPSRPTPAAKNVAMAEGSKTNDVVNVIVTITDTAGVFATAFEVVFDSAHAAYLGFTPGSALEAGGNVPNYTVDGGTNPGLVIVGIARTNGTGTNIVGTKAILSLQFRVSQPGVSPVSIQNGVVYDSQATPQPISNILWFAGALTGS